MRIAPRKTRKVRGGKQNFLMRTDAAYVIIGAILPMGRVPEVDRLAFLTDLDHPCRVAPPGHVYALVDSSEEQCDKTSSTCLVARLAVYFWDFVAAKSVY